MPDLTLSLDTNAYASGDVLADTQAVTGAFRTSGGRAELQSLTVIDEDDQGVAFDVWFFGSNVSLGTENGAPDISDANAREVLGFVSVVTGDYKDLGGVKVACLRNLALPLQAAAGSRDLYVGLINGSGTPTFSASGLRLRLGIVQR